MDNLEHFLTEPETDTPETDEAQRKCHQHPARCGEFVFPLARSLERRLHAQSAELERVRAERDRLQVKVYRFIDAEAERDAQVAELQTAMGAMLNSARPHPMDNPAMFEAWTKGRATLAATSKPQP